MNYEAIKEFCIKDKTKLETDDKIDACFEGYLYAIRTYSPKYGKFKEYSEYCMKTYIKKSKNNCSFKSKLKCMIFHLTDLSHIIQTKSLEMYSLLTRPNSFRALK